MTKEILLGNKKEKLYTIVDDEDYAKLIKLKWNFNGGYVVHSITSGEDRGKKIRMHRLIMHPNDDDIVDHINGNTLDNRKSNLRITNETGNIRNSRKMEKKKQVTSKYKGVSWDKQMSAWKVSIRNCGKVEHLGYFNNEDVAGYVYNLKAKKIFGEFAWLNEINDCDTNIEKYRVKRKKSSQYFGVTWNKNRNKWEGQLYINKKIKKLGLFENEIDAGISVNNYITENNLNKPLNKIPSERGTGALGSSGK